MHWAYPNHSKRLPEIQASKLEIDRISRTEQPRAGLDRSANMEILSKFGITTPLTHRWKFIRVGDVDQVTFRNGQDIIHLDQLDQKLWVALACPTKLVEFDSRTLEILDLDKDGRIRAPEMIDVIRWVREVFKNPDDLLKSGDSVALSAINESTAAGASILAGAKQVLANLGKTNEEVISLADVSDTARIFAATQFNGDGIVPPDAGAEDAIKKVIDEIILTLGGLPDRSGKLGVNQAKLDAFFAESAALVEWDARGQADPAIFPIGDQTPVAAGALRTLRTKVDDYFTRTRLAAFDTRATAILNRSEAEFIALASKDLTASAEEIARLPIARIEPGRALPLKEGLNPAWSGAVAQFSNDAVHPLFPGLAETLTEENWKALQSKLSAYEKWFATKPVTAVEKLGLQRLREIMQSGARDNISALIQQDAALAAASEQINSLEKLVRVQRDLFRLLNNFVSFSDFYSRRGAIFQAGTLYLDGRSCDLCVHVADTAKHAALAGLAKAYLAYCDCTRAGSPKMTIAVAFTAGDSDQLMLGRNGVFYDRKGRDWDATITKIVDNPISIRQAFWAPYKKFVRMIEEQVAKRAAAAESASQAKLNAAAAQVANIDASKPPVPVEPKKVDVGTVAALGVALGSLATFLGLMFAKFIDLGFWAPFALIGILLAISGPSVLIAWLKLRQRNLAPILDANGWAVNGRMKINVPFGGALSKTPKLPPGSELQLSDPFGESHNARNITILVLIFLAVLGIAWRLNLLNALLPPALQRKTPEIQVIAQPGAQINVTPVNTATATNAPPGQP